ncbi:MAG: sulfatase [Planctomycetes bacterium]|nr:sulfatase [Planctomycetota bacterium]
MKHRTALIALFLAACNSSTFAADRPNLIFFLSDDHRADVLGCAGHPIVKTPHIDTLASQGLRFTDAFVTTSICAASRATILTGLVERTHGYTFGKPPISRAHIADSYPAQLKAAGYRTGFIGKFGVKVEGGRATIDTMFDSFVPLGRSQKQPDGSTRHFTDIAGDKAIDFIVSNPEDKPFCLSVSFNAAHASDGDMKNHFPYPASEAALYQGLKMPRPKLDGGKFFDSQPEFLRESLNRDRYYWRWDTVEKYDRNMRNYFRMLSGLDRNIGRVMAELKQRDLIDNTVIIFMGDNGYYMGERGFAGKWSHYEQSLRVPLVIHDPRSKDKPGDVSSNIALNLDIAPTLLQLANVSLPKGYQGVSITELAKAPAREGFFCEHRMNNERIPKWEGFRGKRFVYANYYEQKSDQELLHDLKNDPDQLKNLATDPEYAEVLAAMRAKTRRWSQRYANASKTPAAPL